LQRLAAMALTLLGVSLLIFTMIRLVPGTVVEQLLGQAAIASPEVLAAFRRFFGLDRPVHLQYIEWLASVLRGDFGVSWLSGRPVLAMFLERVPVSAELAALTLGTATGAMITRMSRSTMLDVLGREYVRTARAKGLPERRVTFHHALRNALIPVVTVAGVQLGYIVGGIVVVEDVFTLPG